MCVCQKEKNRVRNHAKICFTWQRRLWIKMTASSIRFQIKSAVILFNGHSTVLLSPKWILLTFSPKSHLPETPRLHVSIRSRKSFFFFFFFAHCNNPEDRYVKNRLVLMKHLGFTCWNMIKFTILLRSGIISWWSLLLECLWVFQNYLIPLSLQFIPCLSEIGLLSTTVYR